jgi:adenylosuccinate synthase
MQRGKFNVVTDGQFGSTGKGLITSYLAQKHRPEFLSNTNMANAGHTAVNVDGTAYIAKAMPSAAILRKWLPGYNPWIIMGSSSAFTLPQLIKEVEITGSVDRLIIHQRAMVITEEHRQRENEGKDSTKHLASTMQGCGAAIADKIQRLPGTKLAVDYEELSRFVFCKTWTRPSSILEDMSLFDPFNVMCKHHCEALHEYIDCVLRATFTFLHEGAQGFSLDINHGHSYPTCTSRGTSAIQNLADMGISPKFLGDVYLVLRPYPIRVGNVIEDGVQQGYSGGGYDDQVEIDWEEIARKSGMPLEYATILREKEKTTVTKRVRRVFSFSKRQLREAVMVNGATKLALNFANYIDWACFASSSRDKLTTKILDFIKMLEDDAGIPVTLVGTGPQYDHVIDLS